MYIVRNISYEYDQFETQKSALEFASERVQENLNEVFGIFELKTVVKSQGVPVDSIAIDTIEGDISKFLETLTKKSYARQSHLLGSVQAKCEGRAINYID